MHPYFFMLLFKMYIQFFLGINFCLVLCGVGEEVSVWPTMLEQCHRLF
jgi:hypothetical protein